MALSICEGIVYETDSSAQSIADRRQIILNSTWKNFRKVVELSAYYTTQSNLLTPQTIQTERAAIFESDLTSDMRLSAVVALYRAGEDCLTLNAIQSERRAIMGSTLSDFEKSCVLRWAFTRSLNP